MALEKKFNTSKKNMLIRPEGKATKRPFLSSDLLRSVLEANAGHLKQSDDLVERFVEAVVTWNTERLGHMAFELFNAVEKDKKILESCIEKKFALAYDPKLPWILACLVASRG
jgi:hypothetical protein